MTNSSSETIFALSSGAGRAGVAVVRVSGPQASTIVEAVAGGCPPPRQAVFRRLRDPKTGEVVDRGIVLWLPAPHSFTGEDVAELQCHGSRAVIAALFKVLSSLDRVRLAEPGEFSRRAFANDALDLTEAEGIADLIEAETDAQRRQAVRQSSGVLAVIYEGWRASLIEAGALMEAAIDFSDEDDVARDAVDQAHRVISQVLPEIRAHLDDGRRGEIVRDGFRVVLAGPVNAGKSSLLNWLAQRDAAIVSEEPGTTRDTLEVHLDLDGYAVIVTDTAGLRDGGGAVEREGMARARAKVAEADLSIWLHPADAPSPIADEVPAGAWVVTSKADLADPSRDQTTELAISTVSGAGLTALQTKLANEVAQRLGETETQAVTSARHRQQLEQCVHHLDAFAAGDRSDPELRAEDLRLAATALGRITGRIDVEDILDQVFGRFCIGK